MALTREQAVTACEQVRAANARRWFSAARWQCWGCIRFGGEPEKRCMHDEAAGTWDSCPHVSRQAARSAG